MPRPKRWDIWLAWVKFEDSDEVKNRPVLIIDDVFGLVLSLKITSHNPRKNIEGEYRIKRWKGSGLAKPSVVRITKRIRLPYDKLVVRLGTVQKEDADEITEIYSKMYNGLREKIRAQSWR